jgi:hypothetical protein
MTEIRAGEATAVLGGGGVVVSGRLPRGDGPRLCGRSEVVDTLVH